MQKRVWRGRRQKERVKFGEEECGVAWRAEESVAWETGEAAEEEAEGEREVWRGGCGVAWRAAVVLVVYM